MAIEIKPKFACLSCLSQEDAERLIHKRIVRIVADVRCLTLVLEDGTTLLISIDCGDFIGSVEVVEP